MRVRARTAYAAAVLGPLGADVGANLGPRRVIWGGVGVILQGLGLIVGDFGPSLGGLGLIVGAPLEL